MTLDGLSNKEIGVLLASELKLAPEVKFTLDASSAFHLVGLLQLACRHPQITRRDVDLIKSLADQVKQIGPAVAEVINWGWDPTRDEGRQPK